MTQPFHQQTQKLLPERPKARHFLENIEYGLQNKTKQKIKMQKLSDLKDMLIIMFYFFFSLSFRLLVSEKMECYPTPIRGKSFLFLYRPIVIRPSNVK